MPENVFTRFPGKVESCLPHVDVCDKRHETDGERQQPALWMRSETGQQHVCHQAPALNLPQLTNKITVCLCWRRHARRKAQTAIASLKPAGDKRSPVHLLYGWMCIDKDTGCQDSPRKHKARLLLCWAPIKAAVNLHWCLLLHSRVMADIDDWLDSHHVQGLPASLKCV